MLRPPTTVEYVGGAQIRGISLFLDLGSTGTAKKPSRKSYLTNLEPCLTVLRTSHAVGSPNGAVVADLLVPQL